MRYDQQEPAETDRGNENGNRAGNRRARACNPTDRRREFRWSLALSFFNFGASASEFCGIENSENFFRLRTAEFPERFANLWIFIAQRRGRKECCVDGTGFADGESPNRNAARHLRNGEERI